MKKLNRELRSTEEQITEKKQGNRNISWDNIYRAIGCLKPEHQTVILTTYKLPELYNILGNDENCKKHINDLLAVSDEYKNRALAFSALHTEAFIRSMKKQEAFDPANTMCQVFDSMPEADQKRFCEGMMKKEEFFEDAYKMMMGSFQNAVEIENGDKEVCEKMGNEVEN